MAINYPGPYEVEHSYTIDGLTHKFRLNFDVVTPPSVGDTPAEIDLQTRMSGTLDLDTALDEFTDLIKVVWSAAVTLTTFDVWKYTPDSFEKTYISSGSTGKAGTNGGSYSPANQVTYTARTLEGGIHKLVLLETVSTSDLIIPYGALGAGAQAIMDYIADADTWILGRDTSYCVVPLNQCNTQNEAVYRKRFR